MATDDMFYSNDESALKRGKRAAPRTETCRPCLMWAKGNEKEKFQGVAMDLNPYGMLIRCIDRVPLDTVLLIQLMRDENYSSPLARPFEGKVVRQEVAADEFTDHGIMLIHENIRREESPPVEIEGPTRRPVHKTRMHTIDITVGENSRGRGGR